MQFFRRDNHNLINVLKWTGAVLFSFGVLSLLFIAPPNVEFTRQYYDFGLERIVFLLILFTALIRIEGFWGKALTFFFTLLLFSLSLIYKWQTADNFSTISGLLPVRDANDYYQGAQMILHGLDVTGTSTFRPMFTAFLSTIMWIVNGNLQFSLFVLVCLNAIAVFWTTLEINRILKNSFFAAIYLLLGYIFFRRFSGTLLTENLGFLVGNLALFFLLRGSFNQRLGHTMFGLFLLTIGLNARAGAFFILPVLVLWIAMSFQDKYNFWRTFFLGVGVGFVAMAGNWILAGLIDSPTSAMFSNYSYTLYGLAAGNKGWEQVLIDYPGVSGNEIFTLAFDKIKNDPILFLKGIVGAYTDYFVASKGAFSFLLLKRDRNDILNIILWALSLAGLATALTKWKFKQYSISLAFFVGIILSVGLVPPADSTQMRAYAATIPMSLYIVVTSGGALSQILTPTKRGEEVDAGMSISLPALFSGVILSASFLIPFILKQTGSIPVINPAGVCEPGTHKAAFVIADGSSLTIDEYANSSYIPVIEHSRFMNKLLSPDQLADGGAVSFFSELKSGTTLTLVRLVASQSDSVSVSTSAILVTNAIPQKGVQTLCVGEPVVGSFYVPSNGTYEPKTESTLKAQTLGRIYLAVKTGLWLLLFVVLIKSTRLLEFSARILPLAFVNNLFIASGLLLLIHTTGLLPLAWERQSLDPENFRNPEGFMYVYTVGTEKLSDTKLRDYPAFLYEDDILLPQPHESQSLISEYGRGRYILREKVLFFSASDNSDPKVNKKHYLLEYPMEIRIRYQVILFGLGVIGVLAHLFYFLPILKSISKEVT